MPTPLTRIVLLVAAGFLFLAAIPSMVLGFGTSSGRPVVGLGGWYFYQEHASITRAALSCEAANSVRNCFEPKTMDALAGGGALAGTNGFGAVGAADNYSYKGSGPVEWHCAEGDYIPPVINGVATGIDSYPTTEAYAKAVFRRCREFVQQELITATGSPIGTHTRKGNYGGVLGIAQYYFTTNHSRSGPLTTGYTGCNSNCFAVDATGQLSYVPATLGTCYFSYYSASGSKCYVLNSLGRALHAVEDFYAHSNWGDIADPDRPVSIDNPPGLGKRQVGPFWDLTMSFDQAWTPGLSSGCYPNSESRGLPSGAAADCSNRACDIGSCTDRSFKYHGYSKDIADFNWRQGAHPSVTCGSVDGCQPRGAVRFRDGTLVEQNVVRLAITDVRRVWAQEQDVIRSHFGITRGETIICYITRDFATQADADRKCGTRA